VNVLRDDESIKALNILTGVHGIGPKTAVKLIS